MALNSNFILEFISTTPKRKAFINQQTNLEKQLTKILNTLKKEPKAAIFLNKVNKKEVPSYYYVIKNPMDLGTMTKKLCLYKSIADFKADLDLIWNNCLIFNAGVEYYIDCAKTMQKLSESLLNVRERVFPQVDDGPIIHGSPIFTYKEEIEKAIVEYLKLAGFESSSKMALSILTDLTCYKIESEIKDKCKKTD